MAIYVDRPTRDGFITALLNATECNGEVVIETSGDLIDIESVSVDDMGRIIITPSTSVHTMDDIENAIKHMKEIEGMR